MKKVAIYISTTISGQQGKLSLKRQKSILRKKCKTKNLDLSPCHIYKDIFIRGIKTNKPALAKLLINAKTNQFDVVCTLDLSSFSAKNESAIKIYNQIRSYGIKIVFYYSSHKHSKFIKSLEKNNLLCCQTNYLRKNASKFMGVKDIPIYKNL